MGYSTYIINYNPYNKTDKKKLYISKPIIMPKNGPFSGTEGNLDTYFQRAVPHVITHAVRFGVSEQTQTNLSSCLENWNTIYPLSKDKDARTITITKNKNKAKEELQDILRSVYSDIPKSVLTISDRNTLNLPERSKTRTPAAVPSTNPSAQTDAGKRLQHTIHFTDFDGSLAKPKGVRGCQIWMKIGSVVVDLSELTYIVTCTKSPYIHHFNGADAGKPVYYWLRWENTRGQTGPWSNAIMATVQG